MKITLMSLIVHIPHAVTIAEPNYIVLGTEILLAYWFFKLITLAAAKVCANLQFPVNFWANIFMDSVKKN